MPVGLPLLAPGQAFAQGAKTGMGLAQAPQINKLNQLKMLQAQANLDMMPLEREQAQLSLDTGRANLQAGQRDLQLKRLGQMGLFAQAAKSLPMEQRRPFLEGLAPIVGEFKEGEDSDENLDLVISKSEAARKALMGVSSGSNFQFGAQETFVDSKGNMFFGTQKRNPKTGKTESVLSPVGDGPQKPVGKVSMVDSLGLTAAQRPQQRALEVGAEEGAKSNQKIRAEYVKQGLVARSMMPKTEKLLELNKLIKSGKKAVAKKAFTDFFGTTDADIGEFDAMSKALVLDNIRSLGANPTEGERAFLTQMTAGLGQGGKVNDRILKNMLEIQKRQVARAKWLASNPTLGVEDYFLQTDTDDFTPIESAESAEPDDIKSRYNNLTPAQKKEFEQKATDDQKRKVGIL